jgi:hypothetical protein
MYKLRTMLLSFALLAIVGIALAFKARIGNTFLCTTATNGNPDGNLCTDPFLPWVNKYCPNFVVSATFDHGQGYAGIFCTTTAQDLDGNGITNDCYDPVLQTTLPCFAARTLYFD